MPNVKLNALYPRRYVSNGQESVHWLQVGVGWMTDKGIDLKLWVNPPADNEGNIRIILREPTREEADREAAYQQRREAGRPQQRQQRSGPQVEYRNQRGGQEAPPPQGDDEPPF